MDVKPPERRPRRSLRVFFGVALVLVFLGSVGWILLTWPVPLVLLVALVVVAALSAAVFAAYFVPNKLSERMKRAVTVGVGAIGLVTTLIAVPAAQDNTETSRAEPSSASPSSSPGQSDQLTTALEVNAACEDFMGPDSLATVTARRRQPDSPMGL